MKSTLLFALVVCFGAACSADENPKTIKAVKPPDGVYGPNPKMAWYAGEVVTIKGDTFHWKFFTDALPGPPDRTGSIKVFKDHILLDDPKVPNPERIADVINGVPVLWTKDAYQSWKKTGEADWVCGLLYFHQQPAKTER